MLKVFYLKSSDPVFARLAAQDFHPWMEAGKFMSVLEYKSEKVRREKWLGEWLVGCSAMRLFHLFPSDYRLEKGAFGKPFVAGLETPFYFNLSHSGEYIVCALADKDVGIDIERIREPRLAVARRFFHPEEIRCLEAADGEAVRELFYTYWSVKESYVKYIGEGLGHSLSSFKVSIEGADIRIWEDGRMLPVRVQECRLDPGYKCFVCSDGGDLPELVRLTRWLPSPQSHAGEVDDVPRREKGDCSPKKAT